MEAFLSDYTVQLSDIKQTSLEGAAPVDLCESCDSKAKATAYCYDCPAHLCESCVSLHQVIKFLKGHKVEDISSEGVIKKYPLSLENRTIYCSIHPEKKFELYCKTCQCVVCVLCFVASHNGHHIGNIDSDTRTEVIEGLVCQVKAKLGEFEEDLRYINEIEQDKTKESISLKEEINKSFDSLVAAIEARRTALVEEVEAASVKDLKEIWAQKEVVETSIIGTRGALALATRSLQCTKFNDLELLLLGAQVSKRLKELSENNWDPSPIVDVEMTSKMFSSNPPCGIDKLGQIGKSTSICSVSIQETTFTLGEPITFQSRTSKYKNFQVNFRVLHGRRRVDIPHPPVVVASEAEVGTFSVSFTPVVSGEHVIMVEGKAKDWSSEYTITVTGEPPIGARVQRGPDWTFGNQDGGEGSHGTISRKSTKFDPIFIVLWDSNRSVRCGWGGNYNEYDFQLVLQS